MRIVVVGMGEVGKYIATVLVDEGHDVVIVDSDPGALERAEELFDAMVLRGHGANVKTLREAGVAETDLFIAVTDHDEVNMLAAIRARDLGATTTVARVADAMYFTEERGTFSGMLGIDLVVNPDVLVALEMHKVVRSANAVAVEDFAANRIEMIQFHVDEKAFLTGRPLHEVDFPENTLVAALVRGGEIVVPRGSDVVRGGDDVIVVGRLEQIPAVEQLFKRERRRFTRRVIIVGGTAVAEALAHALAHDGIEVIVIDRDKSRCVELSHSIASATILHGDGMDVHLLEEERVAECDAFVAVSGHDEVNVMASLVAKDMGAPRVIALVHRPEYRPVCEHLGLDATLSPRLEVAKQVLKWVRAGEVVHASPVLEGKGEFLEFVVPESARIVGKPIRDVEFPTGANICAVCSGDRAYVPDGDDVIEPGDRVVVFTTPDKRSGVERVFRKKRLFGL